MKPTNQPSQLSATNTADHSNNRRLFESAFYWLRWIAALPGAILAAAAIAFPLHWFLYSTLSDFVTPYPEWPERALTPLAVLATFVWAGGKIAPEYKFQAGIAFFGICMALLGAAVSLAVFTPSPLFQKYFLDGWGIEIISMIAGPALGLFRLWKTTSQQQADLDGKFESADGATEQESLSPISRRWARDTQKRVLILLLAAVIFSSIVFLGTRSGLSLRRSLVRSTDSSSIIAPRQGDLSLTGGSPTIRSPYTPQEDDPATSNDESNDQPIGHFGTVTLGVVNLQNGHRYVLDADVEEQTLHRIYFPKGGWVDFESCELDEDLQGDCEDERGRQWAFEGEKEGDN